MDEGSGSLTWAGSTFFPRTSEIALKSNPAVRGISLVDSVSDAFSFASRGFVGWACDGAAAAPAVSVGLGVGSMARGTIGPFDKAALLKSPSSSSPSS